MSVAIAIVVRDGIVAVADASAPEHGERRRMRALSVHAVAPGAEMLLITAGERTMRDRALSLFEGEIAERDTVYRRIHKAVDALGGRVRQVTGDVRAAGGPEDGLPFRALVGGRLEDDAHPELYVLENDGLWAEVSDETPYRILGRSAVGAVVLDQVLTFHTTLDDALKLACLAVHATIRLSIDAAYPLDVALLPRRGGAFLQRRLHERDLAPMLTAWDERVRAIVGELPSPWPVAAGFGRRVIV